MPSRLLGRIKKLEGRLGMKAPMHVIRIECGQEEQEALKKYEQEYGPIEKNALIVYLVSFAGRELSSEN